MGTRYIEVTSTTPHDRKSFTRAGIVFLRDRFIPLKVTSEELENKEAGVISEETAAILEREPMLVVRELSERNAANKFAQAHRDEPSAAEMRDTVRALFAANQRQEAEIAELRARVEGGFASKTPLTAWEKAPEPPPEVTTPRVEQPIAPTTSTPAAANFATGTEPQVNARDATEPATPSAKAKAAKEDKGR
jgi:hypothetical protein